MKRLAGWGSALLVVWATAAPATVPSPERIASAVASENAAADRTQPLRFELRVQIGDRPSVASGTLFTDPSGRARLELRGANGLVERHLLRGGEVFATRNGEPLEEHRFFLPPLYVLQVESGSALRRSLEELQIGVDTVGLSQCDEEDCLVVGDPALEIPRRAPPEIQGLELYDAVRALAAEQEAAEAAGFSIEEWQEMTAALEAEGVEIRSIVDLAPRGGEGGSEAPPAPSGLDSLPENELAGAARAESPGEGEPLSGAPETETGEVAVSAAETPVVRGGEPGAEELEEPVPLASPGLWIDRKSYGIRGLDAAGGVRTRLGPEAVYDGVRFPGWVEIQEPGREAVRLHVLAISPVLDEPEMYGPAWLLEPQNLGASDSVSPGEPDRQTGEDSPDPDKAFTN
ncbi:MAG: hypothetical protein P8Q97_01355 [Myxococcota bacterium]|nr:hypothetical protein [Myxococcota bacterium]